MLTTNLNSRKPEELAQKFLREYYKFNVNDRAKCLKEIHRVITLDDEE